MGKYRIEWDCCGSVTETEAWQPEHCPFCTPKAAGCKSEYDQGWHEGREALRVELVLSEKIEAADPTEPVSVSYTEGHCKEKAQPGGCQLHNLHCGYPDCDRKILRATNKKNR